MKGYSIRPLLDTDREEHGVLLLNSFNTHYFRKGWKDRYMGFSPNEATLFYDVYKEISPGHSFAAIDDSTGLLAGACFYHPREYHVSLGVMAIHPEFSGRGIGKALVESIINFTKENNYKSLRLTGSALNMESFSLYNRCGFVPRQIYNTLLIPVKEDYKPLEKLEGSVRKATLQDIDALANLENEVSGISRKGDYTFAIENTFEIFEMLVYESSEGIEGFMMSIKHPASQIIGPGAARDEHVLDSLISVSLNRFKDTSVMTLLPMEQHSLIRKMYDLGGRNIETHLYQVWGEFQGFKGLSIPGFMPETG